MPNKLCHGKVAIVIEGLFHLLRARLHFGKVETQDEILVVFFRRMLTDVYLSEKFLKFFSIVNTVICFQHGKEKRLTKAVRTDQEQIGRLTLYHFDKPRLVHVIIVLPYQAGEVGYSIG